MALPAGSYQPAEVSYKDAGNEIGTMRFYGPIISAANFTATVALWATMLTKLDALALGARVKDRFNDESIYDVDQPVNGAAREVKLLIQYKDATTGERYTTTLPTLDPTLPEYVQNINAKDVILTTSPTEITDLITAFEAFAIAPRTNNPVEVIGLQVVGRST